MCGISGFIRRDRPLSSADLLRMGTAIRHRGPDDEGYFCLGPAVDGSYSGEGSVPEVKALYPPLVLDEPLTLGMGFRRLAIFDLSAAGHQPMLSADEQLVITFNGAIYNYQLLKRELEEQGFAFKSNTDTEVILNGYACWGREVVHKLKGMFAFVIADRRRRVLWMVRDRMGIKPLFYHQSEKGFTWASEIKAILKVADVDARLCMNGQVENLFLQTTPPPDTCFEKIYALEPATWMEINMQTLQAQKETYWTIPVGQTVGKYTMEEAAAELDKRLYDITRAQLQADVPLITMMSGGIDSTTVTAIAKMINPGIECYSMGYDGSGQGGDELPHARALAQKLGIRQHIHMVQHEQNLQELDAGLRHFEEPYTGPEVSLSAAHFIREQGFKVVLSGNGADELFGGYDHILGVERWKQRKKWRTLAPFVPPFGTFLSKVKHHLQLQTGFQYYAQSRSAMRPYDMKELLLPAYIPVVDRMLNRLQGLESEAKFRNEYEALFYYDLKYSVSGHHVYRDDLSAMRYGLEMRYPYLDHSLIEWVASLPLSLRYNGNTNKPLLRAAAARHITDINLQMPKKGFNLPVAEWWRENRLMKDYMDRQLSALKKRGIFNNNTIGGWQENAHTFFDLSRIWQLVTTEIWMQTYLD